VVALRTTLNPLFQLKRLYHWTMKWAAHPKSLPALAILAWSEGCFNPIPVDPFLVAMGTAQPRKSLKFSAVASVFSVLGGLTGFLLGFWFWQSTQVFFFEYIIAQENFLKASSYFQDNALITLFIASFTPIPYKVFALAAGVAHISLPLFFLVSLVGRSLRFFLLGGLLYFWGPPIRNFIEKYFETLTILLALICLTAYLTYRTL